MATIIPAINAPDFEVVEKRIFEAKNFLPPDGWIHIDVVDGRFAMNVTWGDAEKFAEFLNVHITLRKINFEVHLMVLSPEKFFEGWLKAGARRIIVHEEAMVGPELIIKTCGDYGAEAMVAVKPETPVENFVPLMKQFKQFQILAVPPGFAGQNFNNQVINKIKFLRERAPDATIEVDGGMNPALVASCFKAGADTFVSASYIFGNAYPPKAFRDLAEAASGS